MNYLKDSFQDRKALISSIIYFEQLHYFTPSKKILPLENELQNILRDRIANNELDTLRKFDYGYNENIYLGEVLTALLTFCSNVERDSLILQNFKKIDFKTNLWSLGGCLEIILLNAQKLPLTYQHIKSNFYEIISGYISTISGKSSALLIPKIFKVFKMNYDNYSESETGNAVLYEMFAGVLDAEEQDSIGDLKGTVHNMDEVESMYEDLKSSQRELERIIFPTFSSVGYEMEMDKGFWLEKIRENNPESDYSDYERLPPVQRFTAVVSSASRNYNIPRNEDDEINDLFLNR